jgi:hypothetical protein
MSTRETNTPEAAPVMVGKRLPFWKNLSWGGAAFALISPLLVLWAARWFIGMARGYGHLFDDGHVGNTIVGALFFTAVAVAGFVGIWAFFKSVRTVVLESACPCCGAREQRSFEDPSKADSTPAACGVCPAYLRAHGVEVSEERPEAVSTTGLAYEVPPARYLPTVERDNGGRFKFEMPAMCAVCGSSDANQIRDIGEWGKHTTDLGPLGAVASMAADEISTDAQLSYRGRLQHSAPITTKSPPEQLDEGLRGLKAPVCAAHAHELEVAGNALEYRSGGLLFASYRYYKAFCVLNKIEGPKPPVAG